MGAVKVTRKGQRQGDLSTGCPQPLGPLGFPTLGPKAPSPQGAQPDPQTPPPLLQVHVYDPYDDDYYQTVPLDSHQAAYISSGHYGHQYGGGWPAGPGGGPGGGPGRSPVTQGPFSLAAPGVTHVIVREDPYRVSGDQMALGLLAGAATGAALGSFMWMPCWF